MSSASDDDFTATTPSWIRGILADDYGVDVSKIQWRAWQKPNVPEWKDPPNVTMIPAKFLGRNGGTTANAIKAVDYLTDLKTRHGLNIVATNNSWGGGGFSQALLDAINRSRDADILFIAAAGNSDNDNTFSELIPSGLNLPNLITVGAIDQSGKPTSFTTFGGNVKLYANGFEVESVLPGGARVRRVRTRHAAGRHFVDLVVGVAPDAGITQAHAAADEIEATVRAALPNTDVRRR